MSLIDSVVPTGIQAIMDVFGSDAIYSDSTYAIPLLAILKRDVDVLNVTSGVVERVETITLRNTDLRGIKPRRGHAVVMNGERYKVGHVDGNDGFMTTLVVTQIGPAEPPTIHLPPTA